MLLRQLKGTRSVVAFGVSLGDNLLCTPVLAGLHSAGRGPLAMLTPFPDLFEGLPFPVQLLSYSSDLVSTLRRGGPRLNEPFYGQYFPEIDRHIPAPHSHLIVEMCRSVGLRGEAALKPLWRLTEPEQIEGANRASGHIVIQSSAAGAIIPSANKEWPIDRWQAVAHALTARFPITQIGSLQDPLLPGVEDWRGRLSRREAAATLAAARLFVGPEGFLMHLARAVDCRSVIVLGGRTAPEQTCYPENANLYSPVPCAPCWRSKTCDFDRICLDLISPDNVLAAIDAQLSMPPLNGPGTIVSL